ncbi:MAG TPA: serine hydrolase [Acetobacteraceae bacterium]|jgi:CubicO group peptidase (beta-lactamase class C family)
MTTHASALPRIDPAAAGFAPALLDEAVRFAAAHEIAWPRDLRAHIEAGFFEAPPDNEILGPIRARGPANGLILRDGSIVASWGDPLQVDFTFSAAKSYLSLLAGIAVADGLIASLDEPVAQRVQDGGFEAPHNARITWRHLLQQTSEWEGTLFGKSDVIDRNRSLVLEGKGRKGDPRPLRAPGTFWEYNDVRVNRLALALLRVLRRPLPEVFRARIMQPIGASDDWRWHGYRTSMVEIEGRMTESVSGGSHWGGGVEIHAEDQARIGLLMLQRGVWNGRNVLPSAWIEESLQPCPLNPNYGLLWWLNTGGARYPSGPASGFYASGAGGNITWVDPEHRIVAVMRWMERESVDRFLRLLVDALRR